MTTSNFKRRFGVIVFIVLTLFMVPVLIVAVAMIFYQVQIKRMGGVVEEVAERSQARSYERHPVSPSWTLEPGSAAEAYQQAFDGCDIDQLSQAQQDSMTLVNRELDGRPVRDNDPPDQDPETAILDPRCVAAGIPADAMDSVVAQLHPDLCDTFAGCSASLDLLETGSRRKDTSSPANIWSTWVLDSNRQSERMWGPRFIKLARFEALRGHIAELNGDRAGMLESHMVTLRLGQDLSRGSGLIGAMVGAAIQQHTCHTLVQEITDDRLTAEEATWLVAELDYIRSQPIRMLEALEDDWVTLAGYFPLRDDVPVPAISAGMRTEGSLGERMLFMLGVGTMLDQWSQLLVLQSSPYKDRLQGYAEMEAEASGSKNFWVSSLPSTQTFDARMAVLDSRLLLLQIAAAEALYRRVTGVLPTTLMDMQQVVPDLPLQDPLTGEDYLLTVKQGQRVLSSPASAADRRMEFGVDVWLSDPDRVNDLRIVLPDLGEEE